MAWSEMTTKGQWGDDKEPMLLPLLPHDLTLEQRLLWHCPDGDACLKRCLWLSDASKVSSPMTLKSPSSSCMGPYWHLSLKNLFVLRAKYLKDLCCEP